MDLTDRRLWVRPGIRDRGIGRDCVCGWLVWRHTDTSAAAVRTILILAWRQLTAQSLKVEGRDT